MNTTAMQSIHTNIFYPLSDRTLMRGLLAAMFFIALVSPSCKSKSSIIRAIPENAKKILLIKNFDNRSIDKSKWHPWSFGLPSMLQQDLHDAGYFRLVSDQGRKTALKEIAMSRSGLIEGDPLEIGRLLGAQWILKGDFSVYGETLAINVQMIDVATAKTLLTITEKGKTNKFFDIMKILTLKILKRFRFDLNRNEIAILQKRVETKSLEASLSNYAGEAIMAKVAALEKRLAKANSNKRNLKNTVDRLRAKASRRFQDALGEDESYSRAKENLNRLALMLPSSI